jgi:hypothetical protein
MIFRKSGGRQRATAEALRGGGVDAGERRRDSAGSSVFHTTDGAPSAEAVGERGVFARKRTLTLNTGMSALCRKMSVYTEMAAMGASTALSKRISPQDASTALSKRISPANNTLRSRIDPVIC